MRDIDQAVDKLRQRYINAVAARNANALIQLYDPKARIFDAWGVWEYNGTAAWQIAVEGWFSSQPTGKLQVSFSDCTVVGSLDLATMTAIVTYASISAEGKETNSMQNRMTWILRTVSHNLRIVHEHTSAPIGFEDMKAILKKQA